MVDTDRTADVLALRARILARPLETAGQEGATIQMLGFEAGGDRFALPVESIVTVMSAVRPTPVPGMPPWLVGAVGVRGRVVAAVDPDRFLGTRAPLDESVERSTAIVIAHGTAELALLVERLDPVESLGSDAVVPCPAGSSEIVGQAARGTVDGRLLLDPDGLITAIRSALHPISAGSSALARPLVDPAVAGDFR